MNCYQKYLNNLFSEYRPSPLYPTYPPYHTGDYLEDYFYKKFLNNDSIDNIYYIPVSWTTVYIQNLTNGLQQKLDSLDRNQRYFVVCQHDDAPKERLPPNCLVFAAGGNVQCKQTIPIPLICSAIPDNIKNKNYQKKYIASFVGSITHPIRQQLCNHYYNNKNFYISPKIWSSSVDKNNLDNFIRITQESYFTFCPRGYGLNSFRLYESFQLNSVPIVVSDNLYLPMAEVIDWNEISIIPKDLSSLEKNLIDIINNSYQTYMDKGYYAYNKYFTLDGLYTYILEKIKNHEKDITPGC